VRVFSVSRIIQLQLTLLKTLPSAVAVLCVNVFTMNAKRALFLFRPPPQARPIFCFTRAKAFAGQTVLYNDITVYRICEEGTADLKADTGEQQNAMWDKLNAAASKTEMQLFHRLLKSAK